MLNRLMSLNIVNLDLAEWNPLSIIRQLISASLTSLSRITVKDVSPWNSILLIAVRSRICASWSRHQRLVSVWKNDTGTMTYFVGKGLTLGISFVVVIDVMFGSSCGFRV
ncbi:hypothetical protein WICPIJ_006208 [Wickerhamomyces pijperi]|uniref:Uncharacterized protein n=1 Tax=Wickerhamomyces pijperi TaxID=599730 RepID=A0A9P8TKF1_WICPI|nr:hypothetical protein WICPIJ_006208 [Wickerhamomyces pijperi]